jgi:hypothetical protein
MQLPMLLGREAMAGRIAVDPAILYNRGSLGKPEDFYR